MERLLQDLRFAIRLLWKDRAFTATTLATLGLCLAANTAIFAVVHSVLLRPLPFAESERILNFNNSYPGAGVLVASNGVPDYYDRLRDLTVLEELAMYRSSGVTIGGHDGSDAERVASLTVTPSFFRLLRAVADRGRFFTEEDGEPGHEQKVVLSHGLWQRAFGGREDVVGQDFRINGVPHTVVGVAAPDFRFLNPDVQLWTPAAFTPADRADDRRHSNSWQQIGRLKPDGTLEQAQAQLDALNARNMERFPHMREILINAGFHTRAAGFHDELVRETRGTLYLLWGGVLVVLLIGAVNIANLVSIRASSRVRELATRAALGASLSRLSRQLLTETVLLAAAGGALGLLLGRWVLGASELLGLANLPRGHEIAVDGTVVLFTSVLILVVGLAVGVFPIMNLRSANLGAIVREEGRSGTPSRRARITRRALVTSQVAFALVLLVGAGLLLASFQRVLTVSPGFQTENLLTGWISLPASRYPEMPAASATITRMVESLRAAPGVAAAAATTMMPFSGSYSDSVILADGYQMAPGESLISPNDVRVSDGFFEAMGIRLLEGRFFDARDTEDAQRTIIIDQRLARRFWPGESALGRYMYFPGTPDAVLQPPPRDQWLTVVGVVDDIRIAGLVDGVDQRVGAYYRPLTQVPARTVSLAVRTHQDPAAAVGSVRAALASVDRELPFYNVRAMSERVDRSLTDRRTPMMLATGFAVVALLLAAIGIYGVLAYQVSQRRREIGIRLALGADSGRIFGMVLGEGAVMIVAGSVLGLLGAFLLRTTLQSQLYEIGAMDPRVIATVALVLLAVAFVACLLPARAAARTDPAIALTE